MARQRKKDLEASASPPAVPPVDPDGVPALLRASDQWVIWKYERRTDNRGSARWTKVPIKVSSRVMASATDPETWCGFDDALAVYRRTRDVHAGVGFVFHRDDPFCGIDLDDCRDPASGEIAQWATDIIRELNSYTEVSPSGTGVKIIIHGFVPGGRNRVKYEGGEFECYDCARFFVITGNGVTGAAFPDLSTDINDAQAAFESIYSRVFASVEHEPMPAAASGGAPPSITNVTDSQLLDRIFSSAVGDGFRRLWYGDTSQCEGDSSRADFQLCRLLAWWCHGDEGRVDGLFRQSGLMRPKWNESRGGGTYGEKTVRFAVGTLRSHYDPAYRRANGTVGDPQPAAPQSASPGGETGSLPPTTPAPPTLPAAATPHQPPYNLTNHIMMPTIQADGRQMFAPRGLSAPEIAGPMFQATDNWPRRLGNQLFVPHAQGVRWLTSASAFFAWASRTLRPGAFGNPINWMNRGADLLTKEEFFQDLGTIARDYEAIERYPHHPRRECVYYCDYPLAGGDGAALARYLDFFNPSTPHDRDLILSVLLTASWGGPPGQRPAFVFISPDGRGAGKTTLAQSVAGLWDGFIKVRVDDDFSEVQRRVLSPEGLRKRFFLVDNVKESRLSLADMEDMITCDRISGRQMYTGEGERPNYFTWLMTYNGVQLSSDLAQRSVIVSVRKPASTGRWAQEIEQYTNRNRPAIIGDLIARLQAPPRAELVPVSRWGLWEADVLSRVNDPGACQDLFRGRQISVDDDLESMELVREMFVTVLRRNHYDPDRCVVFFTSNAAIAVARQVTLGPRHEINSPAKLRLLNIPELQKDRKQNVRGFTWVGPHASYERGVSPVWFLASDKRDATIQDATLPGVVDGLDD